MATVATVAAKGVERKGESETLDRSVFHANLDTAAEALDRHATVAVTRRELVSSTRTAARIRARRGELVLDAAAKALDVEAR